MLNSQQFNTQPCTVRCTWHILTKNSVIFKYIMFAKVTLCRLHILVLVTTTLGLSDFDNTTYSSRPKREVKEPKRYLIFPQGSNVQLVYCMTIGTYTRPQSFFTMGVTAGLAWELPHRDTVPYRKPAEVYHRRSRRELYRKVELMLSTRGRDGKSCVLKALCQAGRRNGSEVGKGSFMQEILHSIFTLPKGSYDDDPKTDYDIAHQSTANCEETYFCPDIF